MKSWYKFSKERNENSEYPVAAVVVADGEAYTGRTHAEALQKAKVAGHIKKNKNGYLQDLSGNDLAYTGAIDLFLTNKGRYIDRFEAYRLGEATGAENIPEEERIPT